MAKKTHARAPRAGSGTGAPGARPPARDRRQALLDCFARRDYAALADAAEAATRLDPADGFYWKALGVARNLLGRVGAAAVVPLREAARLLPADAEVFDALGQALQRAAQPQEAAQAFGRAVALAPRNAVLQSNFGNALAAQHRYREAVARQRAALAIDPRLPDAWVNLAMALAVTPWRHAEAVQALQQAIRLRPYDQAAWDNLLYLRQYQSEAALDDVLLESISAAEQLTLAFNPRPRPPARPLHGRPLRVGWVSADLRSHPVGSAVLAVLPHLAAHGVEVFAYANQPAAEALSPPDPVATAIAAGVAVWRAVAGIDDAALGELIRADGIDVLVDLSGRTRGHRLGVFARRAAPVHVSWLGWFATTGLPQIDWYLGDAITLRRDEAGHFIERGWALAGPYYVQTPRGADVAPAEGTAAGIGPIRFGCFNTLAKLSTRTLDLWANLLRALPDASLFVKTHALADAETAAELREQFARRGIAAERLRLEAAAPLADYLAAFNEVDVSLDPTPYTGGVTSFDSLWMGVPVLSLRGDRYIAHQGETLLTHAGLADWIAADAAGYVARAVQASGELDALRAGRRQRRAQFLASPLTDGARLAGELADAWHAMHQRALAGDLSPRLPASPPVLEKYASIMLHLEDWPVARAAWQQLAETPEAIDPQARASAMAHCAIALQGELRYQEALDAYAAALPLLGAEAAYTLQLNMGACCQQLQRFDDAARHAEAALAAHPGDPVALRNAGSAYLEGGDIGRALACYAKARDRLPDAGSGYLYALNFVWPPDPHVLCEAHRAWGAGALKAAAARDAGLPPPPGATPRADGRALRLGFLSADFRQHPVGFFFAPLLESLLRSGHPVTLLSDVRQADATTAWFMASGADWLDCLHLDDRQLAAAVRAAGIDVLVDLGGHSGPRPAFLAARQAPLQLGWLGYAATSGLTTVDALLTDAALDPPGEAESQYVEPICRLGASFVSYRPPAAAPAVETLPALRGACVGEQPRFTFASFNKPYKLNRETVRLWAIVLRALPDSRLLLVGKGLADAAAAVRLRLVDWFAAEAIGAERLAWEGQVDFPAYLALHQGVDVALDSVPWSGHTVTLHAAWMGVPTLAFAGGHHAGRFSAATMRLLGLDDWVVNLQELLDAAGGIHAAGAERLAARAQALCAGEPALARLADLRSGLRGRILASPLADEGGHARRFVAAVEQLWDAQAAAAGK